MFIAHYSAHGREGMKKVSLLKQLAQRAHAGMRNQKMRRAAALQGNRVWNAKIEPLSEVETARQITISAISADQFANRQRFSARKRTYKKNRTKHKAREQTKTDDQTDYCDIKITFSNGETDSEPTGRAN